MINTNTKTLVLGCANSVIPDDGSVETIGEKVFAMHGFGWSESLTEIVIPSTVKHIDYQAFASTEIKNVVIPQSVKSIDAFAFEGDVKLEKVTFERDCVVNISAFSGCSKLKTIKIPDPLTIYKSYKNHKGGIEIE